MNASLQRSDVSKEFHSYLYMGIDVRKMLLKFGRNAMCLFKLLLAGGKIILYTSCGYEAVCNEVLALCSLIPGGLTHFSEPLLKAAHFRAPVPDRHDIESAETSFFFPHSGRDDDLDWGKLGLPLLPFSNSDVVQRHWSKLSGWCFLCCRVCLCSTYSKENREKISQKNAVPSVCFFACFG